MMYKYMRVLTTIVLLFSFFSLFSFEINAQTYLGLGVGYDFSLIQQTKNHKMNSPIQLYLMNEKDVIGSTSLSAMIEQQLAPNSYLSLTGVWFAKKDAHAENPFSFPIIEYIRFNIGQVKVLFRQELIEQFHIGGGIGLGFNSVKIVFSDGDTDDVSFAFPKNIAYNTHIVMAYNYKHFLWEINFQKGLGFQKNYSFFIKPIDSFGLTMNYLFKMPNKSKKKELKGRF